MASSEFIDPYLDPSTGVLRNKLGASTRSALEQAEGALTFARLVQLTDHPPRATNNLAELRAIHRHLFQDVYDWAGELRIVDMRKNIEGAEHFLPASRIPGGADYAADELRNDNLLRGLDRAKFIERLAHHYDQFNYIHPFREGNGRTQRVFWNRVARDAGWQLDWRQVHGSTNDLACRAASEQRDFQPLRAMFDLIVTPARRGARSAAWRAAERERLSFPTVPSHAPAERPDNLGRSQPSRGPTSGIGRSHDDIDELKRIVRDTFGAPPTPTAQASRPQAGRPRRQPPEMGLER